MTPAIPCKFMWTQHLATFVHAWSGWRRYYTGGSSTRRYLRATITIGDWKPDTEFSATPPACIAEQYPMVDNINRSFGVRWDSLDNWGTTQYTYLPPHPGGEFVPDGTCGDGDDWNFRFVYVGEVSITQQQWKMVGRVATLEQGHYDLFITYSIPFDHSDYLREIDDWPEEVPWDNEVYYDFHHSAHERWHYNDNGEFAHLESLSVDDPGCDPRPADIRIGYAVQSDELGLLQNYASTTDQYGPTRGLARVVPLTRWSRTMQTFNYATQEWDDGDCESFSNQLVRRTLFEPPPIPSLSADETRQVRYFYEFGKQCSA